MSELAARKKALRKEAVAFRQSLSDDFRKEASEKMTDCLLAESVYEETDTVFAYLSMPEEVQLDSFLTRALSDGKTVVIPFIVGKGEMSVVRLPDMEHLVTGAYGIRTVAEKDRVIADPATINLIVVPGAVFTEEGARLGLGAGFYDRFMREKAPRAARIALTFEGLIHKDVPMEDHDEYVDAILTEKRRIACHPPRR